MEVLSVISPVVEKGTQQKVGFHIISCCHTRRALSGRRGFIENFAQDPSIEFLRCASITKTIARQLLSLVLSVTVSGLVLLVCGCTLLLITALNHTSSLEIAPSASGILGKAKDFTLFTNLSTMLSARICNWVPSPCASFLR